MLPEQPGFCRTSLAAINQTWSPNPNRASPTIGGPEENSMRGSEGFTSEIKLGKVKRSFPRHGIKPAQLQTSYLFEEDDISEGDLIQRKKSKTGDMWKEEKGVLASIVSYTHHCRQKQSPQAITIPGRENMVWNSYLWDYWAGGCLPSCGENVAFVKIMVSPPTLPCDVPPPFFLKVDQHQLEMWIWKFSGNQGRGEGDSSRKSTSQGGKRIKEEPSSLDSLSPCNNFSDDVNKNMKKLTGKRKGRKGRGKETTNSQYKKGKENNGQFGFFFPLSPLQN